MSSSSRKILRSYLRPYVWNIMAIATMQIVASVMQVLAISMLKPILDTSIEGYGVEYIVEEGVILLGITFLFAVALSLAFRMSSEVASLVASDLRRDVLAASLRVQNMESAGNTTTFAMTCLTSNVQTVQEFVFQSFAMYLPLPLLAVLMVQCTYYISPTFGQMVAVAMVAVIAMTYLLSRRVAKAHEESMKGQDHIYCLLREKVSGARMIRSYRGQEYENKKFWGYSDYYGSRNLRIAINSYYLPAFSTAFIWIFIVFVYMVAALGVSNQTIRPSHLVLFMQFTTCIISCLAIVPYICLHVPRAMASMDRVADTVSIADDRPKTTDRKEGADALNIRGLAFVDVFGRRMLNGLDMDVRKGEVVTVTGPNGNGLMELVDTILAFSTPTSGAVSVCGMDVATSNPSDIRESISYAGRQSGTFASSLRFNLDPHGWHDDAKILEVCRKTGFIGYVESLGKGLDSVVSASSMSGGQSQLMALTRSLLRDAELYVFDDCFFSMDAATTRQAISAVRDVCSGKAVMFVSHDMSTVALSQKVFLVKGGRVVGEGTHESLLRESPLYSEMYGKSSGGVSC